MASKALVAASTKPLVLSILAQSENYGYRKILGASSLDIIRRFNREYLWLLLIALAIAAPLAYLGLANWLSTFAYRIAINPLVFVLAGIITLAISSLAVSLMTLRVASALPARALREEQ